MSTDPAPRSRTPIVLTVGVLLAVAALVVGAGFVQPLGPGGSREPGGYAKPYRITQEGWSPEAGRCLRVTLAGELAGTWTEPTWSLRGAGWTSLELKDPSVDATVTDECGGTGRAASVDSLKVAQFWLTDTCAEPALGDGWVATTATVGPCDPEDAAGYGSLAEEGDGDEDTAGGISEMPDPGTGFRSSGLDLRWPGTTHSETVCALSTFVAEIQLGIDDTALATTVTLDGRRACLDASAVPTRP